MAVILHAVPLAGVCRKERSSPVPQVRARPKEMRCVGSKRTREVGRDIVFVASIVRSSVAKAHGGNRTVLGGRARPRAAPPAACPRGRRRGIVEAGAGFAPALSLLMSFAGGSSPQVLYSR